MLSPVIKISDRGKCIHSPIHFLLCDRKGGAAAIEFLGGRMRAYPGKGLPVKALTNDTYEYCLDFLKLSGSDETKSSFKQAENSLKRFVWAAKGTQAWDAKTLEILWLCFSDPR